MAKFESKYQSKFPNQHGVIEYTDEENNVWADLSERQNLTIINRACDEYIAGLQLLNLSKNNIPQLSEINHILQKTTGWSVKPVEALISAEYFFGLLANKQFPAACFIRRREEIDYLEEPDIFHEFFGHCPLITNQCYADFMQHYAEIALLANEHQRTMLARLYWFTIEFGLVNTPAGLRIYGGGILSSHRETQSCLQKEKSIYKPFNILDALRTPYLINHVQPIYYILDHFEDLYTILDADLFNLINQATKLGEYSPVYNVNNDSHNTNHPIC